MRAPSHFRRRLWPFGLLVVGWFCANVPHSVAIDLFSWVKAGSHFSHQANLRAATLAALSTATQAPVTNSYASTAGPAKRIPLNVPSAGMTKKTEPLFTQDIRILGNVRIAQVEYRDELSAPPEMLKGDLPHPPPRAGV